VQAGSGSAWPLVGRDNEVRQALAALEDDAEFRGVALVGDSGVGKSTLARALATAAKSRGLAVRFVLGTQTGSAVPLGAFYRSVTVGAPQEPAAMLAAVQRTLEQDEKLVVVVDDAQLLDPLSATLVYQLAAGGSARLIVTIRSGDNVSDAVAALWKERLLLSLRIEAFTWEQTEELARAVLGGVVDTGLITELHDRAAGNPLMLSSLLSAGRESGALVRTDAGWRLQGALRADRQLHDLLESRLRSLAPEELEAVEVLAAAEVLAWEILRGFCDADAVGRLERRGVIEFVADGSNTVARLVHPLLGETAMQRAGVVRSRQLNGMLAQHFRKHMLAEERSRPPDVRAQLQLAQFMMRSDLSPDLDVMINAAASAMTMSNFRCGEEMARFALDHGGGLPAAIVLAPALSWQGRGAEAEAVLVEVDSDSGDEWLTVWRDCLRAANLFWVCGQVEPARLVLAKVRDRVESEAFVVLVTALEVSFRFFCGEVATTMETGPALCASDVFPLATVWAAVPTSWALALAGRFGEVDRIADAALCAAALSGAGAQRFAIGVAEVMAATAAGEYSAAERVWERYAALAEGAPEAGAIVDAMLGLVRLAQGALPSACAAFSDSISAVSRGIPGGWLMLVSAWRAQAEGTRGDGEAAAAALRRSEEAYGPQFAVFLPELELARAWERASVGQTTAAQTHAVRAAQVAQQSGMCAVEMRALHTAVRFGDQSCVSRLEELAGTLNTPLAEASATQARGLANHDGDLLGAAASRFADMGALALAADAMAQAADEHARKGHRSKEVESSTQARWLASQGGLRTPAVDAAPPLPFSSRERDIAMLVEAGLSNREIADRLIISVRTVEGHLYRLFAKLGINNRDQLIHLLRLGRTGT
jgi:DNA-binding CsgD family transcriptional regulator